MGQGEDPALHARAGAPERAAAQRPDFDRATDGRGRIFGGDGAGAPHRENEGARRSGGVGHDAGPGHRIAPSDRHRGQSAASERGQTVHRLHSLGGRPAPAAIDRPHAGAARHRRQDGSQKAQALPDRARAGRALRGISKRIPGNLRPLGCASPATVNPKLLLLIIRSELGYGTRSLRAARSSSMGDRIFLAVILLGAPLFAYAVAYQIDARFEPKWRAAVLEQFPEIDPARQEIIPLRRYCREIPESAALPVCSWYPRVQMLERGALITAALGGALILAIVLMARIARGNRTLLALLFKPGLYLTVAPLILLTLLHAGLFLGAATLGQIATLGHLMIFGFGLIVAVGLGAGLCIVLLARAMLLMLRRPAIPVIGRAVAEQRGPLLWQYVRDLARRIDALPPEHIVVGFDNIFFVIDSDIQCFSGALRGRTLYLSLP